MAVQILFGIVSFVAVVFACRSHMWRGYTESANRRRKRLAEELETLQQAYNVRGDALKWTARKLADRLSSLADMSELRDRAVQKIVELQREKSALENRLLEIQDRYDDRGSQLLKLSVMIEGLESRLNKVLNLRGELIQRIENVPPHLPPRARFRLYYWAPGKGWKPCRKPKAPPVPGYLPNEAA